mgnify:CR=1 FL=1|tara:strand:- start:186 stop:386 length:201 start_codon:yes stop_codon:yes gene_type:complete
MPIIILLFYYSIILLLKFTVEGEIFKLFKLATILKDSPNIDPKTIFIQSDPRVLPNGRVLRKTKIN